MSSNQGMPLLPSCHNAYPLRSRQVAVGNADQNECLLIVLQKRGMPSRCVAVAYAQAQICGSTSACAGISSCRFQCQGHSLGALPLAHPVFVSFPNILSRAASSDECERLALRAAMQALNGLRNLFPCIQIRDDTRLHSALQNAPLPPEKHDWLEQGLGSLG